MNGCGIQATLPTVLSTIPVLDNFCTGYALPTTSSATDLSLKRSRVKPKMGGSTMKTAKVWKYFVQLPTEQQAAECRLCFKRIKATNSSTTGMIRHLRSCHSTEYQMLQAARQVHGSTTSAVKLENRVFGSRHFDELNDKPKDLSTHSIASIIANKFQQKSSTSNFFSFGNPVYDPVQKKSNFDDEYCCAIDLRTRHKNQKNRKGQKEKIRKVKENFWPNDHPDAKQITEQIGLMLLLDNESPTILNRAGFRNLLHYLQPKYQLPSAEQFNKEILPQLCGRLENGAVGLQQNNYLKNRQNEMGGRLNSLTTALLAKKCGFEASNNSENSSVPFINATYNEQMDLDRVIINSVRSAQNISQSFSHSIQLCGDNGDNPDVCSTGFEAPLSARIESFKKHIGECVFPPAELTDLVTRCFYAYRHVEETVNEKQRLASVQASSQSIDLANCVEYVYKNMESIHELHARNPIPMFKPFTDYETQFLSDLNLHIHSI